MQQSLGYSGVNYRTFLGSHNGNAPDLPTRARVGHETLGLSKIAAHYGPCLEGRSSKNMIDSYRGIVYPGLRTSGAPPTYSAEGMTAGRPGRRRDVRGANY